MGTLAGKVDELAIRKMLVKSVQATIEGLQDVLATKQTNLKEREAIVTTHEASIQVVSQNLTRSREERDSKTKTLISAREALTKIRLQRESTMIAYGKALGDFRRKGGSQAQQKKVVETQKTVVAE